LLQENYNKENGISKEIFVNNEKVKSKNGKGKNEMVLKQKKAASADSLL
jgi:hypothetical protein